MHAVSTNQIADIPHFNDITHKKKEKKKENKKKRLHCKKEIF